jgi:cyclohexyl-isocyanide hydratase
MPTGPVTCHIGILLFPDMTQIDFTGPYEILARLSDTCVHVVAKTIDPVRTDRGLVLVPTVSCADCPPLDVIVVPGGPGQQALMDDVFVICFVLGKCFL